jgi:hypothetical protein
VSSFLNLQLFSIPFVSSFLNLQLVSIRFVSSFLNLQLVSIPFMSSFLNLQLFSIRFVSSFLNLQLFSIRKLQGLGLNVIIQFIIVQKLNMFGTSLHFSQCTFLWRNADNSAIALLFYSTCSYTSTLQGRGIWFIRGSSKIIFLPLTVSSSSVAW